MKISKLFHWLYAILMLLPFLVFLPNAFYYGFNEHAVAQEKTEQVPVYYETNDVNTLADLQIGSVYTWNDNYIKDNTTSSYYLNIKVLSSTYQNQNCVFLSENGVVRIYNQTIGGPDCSNFVFDFLIISKYSTIGNMPNSILEKISKCETLYPNGETTPVTTSMSITDSMSYAWDSVWQNDLFSWSYGSFLTEPFIYIGNVFNVPVDNSLYYALSYWLDISIIWLCFDLVMYIPLLVHRWLDKGIIE